MGSTSRGKRRTAARYRAAAVLALTASLICALAASSLVGPSPTASAASSCTVVAPGEVSGDTAVRGRATGAGAVEFGHGAAYASLGTTTLAYGDYFALEYDLS